MTDASEEAAGLDRRVRGALAALPFVLFFLGIVAVGWRQGENMGFVVVLLPGVALFVYLVYRLAAGPPQAPE